MPPFRVNEIVWAKIKGYPHWPARVLDPVEGASVKVARKKNTYFVRFFSADDKNQVSWVPEEELMDFAEKFAELKQAADVKGGKTYLDLRKCIDVASQAHQDYMEDVEKHPELSMNIALLPREEGASIQESAGRGKAKSTAKKEAPATPAPVPRSPRAQAKTAAAAAAPVPEPPIAAETSAATTPRRGRGAKPEAKAESPRAATAAAEAEESGGPDPVLGKRVSKKRAMPDEVPIVNGGGSARKKAAPATKVVTPFKNPLSNSGPQTSARTPAATSSALSAPTPATIKQAREISVGFIGLEDKRAVEAAKQLLLNGVQVRVWAKTTGLAKELEYSGADRITDAEKIFEDADVVFMTAGSGHDLNSLLSGADHLARKIRPAGKNKIKGVCVFSSMSKEDSEAIAKKMLPKNVFYMECAWVGDRADASGQSLVCCGTEQLFNHCKSVFDVVAGRTVFLGADYGLALAAKAYLGIVEGVMTASMVEAGYMAQRDGLQLNKLSTILQGFVSLAEQKSHRILSLPSDPQGNARHTMQQQYGLLRDAVHLAHPVHDAATASSAVITPLTSMTMDLFKTRFISYRCDRSDFEGEKINGTMEKAAEASTSGAGRGKKAAAATPAGRGKDVNRTFTIESGTPAEGTELGPTVNGKDKVVDNVNGEEVLDGSEPTSGGMDTSDDLEQGVASMAS